MDIFTGKIPVPEITVPLVTEVSGQYQMKREWYEFIGNLYRRTGGTTNGILSNTQFDELDNGLIYLAGFLFQFRGDIDIQGSWAIGGHAVNSTANEINYLHGLTMSAISGGIVYSNGTSLSSINGTNTARQVLLSSNAAAPTWSTATYPATTTINRILYSSANNVISEITTTNNGVLITDNSGVPSISPTLPVSVVGSITISELQVTNLVSDLASLQAQINAIVIDNQEAIQRSWMSI